MRLLIVFLSLFFFASYADASSFCRPQSRQITQSIGEPGKFKTAVLCCCPTANGGQCCGNVAICGSFIPGCFCSPHRTGGSLSFSEFSSK